MACALLQPGLECWCCCCRELTLHMQRGRGSSWRPGTTHEGARRQAMRLWHVAQDLGCQLDRQGGAGTCSSMGSCGSFKRVMGICVSAGLLEGQQSSTPAWLISVRLWPGCLGCLSCWMADWWLLLGHQ